MDFQNQGCALIMNYSLIASNQGSADGGAILLKNSDGTVSFFNNLFQNNSLPLDIVSGGGVIAATLTASSAIVFLNNTFSMNSAFIGSHF